MSSLEKTSFPLVVSHYKSHIYEDVENLDTGVRLSRQDIRDALVHSEVIYGKSLSLPALPENPTWFDVSGAMSYVNAVLMKRYFDDIKRVAEESMSRYRHTEERMFDWGVSDPNLIDAIKREIYLYEGDEEATISE